MLQSAPSFKDSHNLQNTYGMQWGNGGGGARKPCPQGASSPVEVAEPLTSAVPSLLGEIQPYPLESQSNGGGRG